MNVALANSRFPARLGRKRAVFGTSCCGCKAGSGSGSLAKRHGRRRHSLTKSCSCPMVTKPGNGGCNLAWRLARHIWTRAVVLPAFKPTSSRLRSWARHLRLRLRDFLSGTSGYAFGTSFKELSVLVPVVLFSRDCWFSSCSRTLCKV